MKLHGVSELTELDLLPYIIEPITNGLKVLSYNQVWDPIGLQWVKDTGTVTISGNITGITDPVTVIQPLGSQLHTVVDSGSVNATLQGTSSTSDINTADILLEILAELRAMNADNGIFTDYI